MHQLLAKRLFLLIEKWRGERVKLFLEDMDAMQWRPAHIIRAIQEERLRDLLEFARARNPYYRNKYQGASEGLHLSELPLLSKQELRKNAKIIVTPGRERVVRLCKTSGSTGAPLAFYRDSDVFGRTLASVYRAQRWYGLDIGAPMAMLWGIPTGSVARLQMRCRDWLLNRFREKECTLAPDVLQAFYQNMRDRKPHFLFGYPSMVYEFALFCDRNDLDCREFALRAAVCTAESIHPHQRFMIEDVLGCPVVSEYGAAETGIISYECPQGSHHVSDDAVLVELLDKHGCPVPEGEVGRVVVTVLFSHSAPIIRYDLGDLAVMTSRDCACGVKLSRLERIVGRTTGIISTPSGRRIHSSILSYVMKEYAVEFGGVRQFWARQTHIDRLELHLVPDEEVPEEAKEWLLANMHKRLGEEVNTVLFFPSELPRATSGKLANFHSDLPVEERLPVWDGRESL